jgi:hypothetical protein
MAPRTHWKGFLKLSFVSCPVSLYSAIAAAERLSFHRVNRRTGNRHRQKLVDEVTGEPVQSEERGRGYQIGEDQLLIVQEDELHAAEEEARNRPFFSINFCWGTSSEYRTRLAFHVRAATMARSHAVRLDGHLCHGGVGGSAAGENSKNMSKDSPPARCFAACCDARNATPVMRFPWATESRLRTSLARFPP